MLVGVCVGVLVGVIVGVLEGVVVGVSVGVLVGVLVGVPDGELVVKLPMLVESAGGTEQVVRGRTAQTLRESPGACVVGTAKEPALIGY